MKIGLVGSKGVLGQILTEQLLLRGHELSLFARQSDATTFRFDVLIDEPPAKLAGVECMVYLAWATKDRSANVQSKHAEAAGRWADYCDSIGIRFIFISTVLAYENTKSIYGSYKYKAEQLVASRNGKSLRVGSVADDAYPLLLTKIRLLVARFPAARALFNWPIFALSSTTFADSVERVILSDHSEATYWVAPNTPTILSDILLFGATDLKKLRWASRSLQLFAKVPVSNSKVDALRGLINQIPVSEIQKTAKFSEVSMFDWQNQLQLHANKL